MIIIENKAAQTVAILECLWTDCLQSAILRDPIYTVHGQPRPSFLSVHGFRVQFGNGVLRESVLSGLGEAGHAESLSLNLADELLSAPVHPDEGAASVLLGVRHPFFRNMPRLLVRPQPDLGVSPRRVPNAIKHDSGCKGGRAPDPKGGTPPVFMRKDERLPFPHIVQQAVPFALNDVVSP